MQVAPAQTVVWAAREMLSTAASVGELFAAATNLAFADCFFLDHSMMFGSRRDLWTVQFVSELATERDLFLVFEIAQSLGFRVVVPGVSTPEEDVQALLAMIQELLREEDRLCGG